MDDLVEIIGTPVVILPILLNMWTIFSSFFTLQVVWVLLVPLLLEIVVRDLSVPVHAITARGTVEDFTATLCATVVAATSSTGMAFLLSTIAEYGDAWPGYWEDLMANGAQLTSSWSDAYEVDFTQGGGKGDRPIVLSYDSSPAFTVPEGSDTSTTSALLDTCVEQVEYAGVLAGAENPDGARAVLLQQEASAADRVLTTAKALRGRILYVDSKFDEPVASGPYDVITDPAR